MACDVKERYKMKDRTFSQEAKAMEFTISMLYEDREFLSERIANNKCDVERDKIRLQMVERFIRVYEEY